MILALRTRPWHQISVLRPPWPPFLRFVPKITLLVNFGRICDVRGCCRNDLAVNRGAYSLGEFACTGPKPDPSDRNVLALIAGQRAVFQQRKPGRKPGRRMGNRAGNEVLGGRKGHRIQIYAPDTLTTRKALRISEMPRSAKD